MVCNVLYSIDATYTNSLCRYVNDSKKGNCVMKKLSQDGEPRLCLFAVSGIKKGDELRYNYGEDSTKLFWRNKVRKLDIH